LYYESINNLKIKIMKRFNGKLPIILALTLISIVAVKAQDSSKFKINVGADLVSNYIWRGVPSIFPAKGQTTPYLSPNFRPSFSITAFNFTLGAWGSYDFAGLYHETDLSLGYAIGPISITYSDYYWNYGTKYFDYKSATTGHIIEGSVAFTGTDKFPLSVSVNTFLYGADKKYLSDPTVTNKKKQNFSTYIEASYKFKVGTSSLTPFIGVTPFDGYYGDSYGNVKGFQVVNIGASAGKTLDFSSKVSIPVKLSLIFNPVLEKSYLVVDFTF
jgi:hypothetical protein